MIKKTLCFGNPAYLCLRNKQLVVQYPEVKGEPRPEERTLPIEDLGVVVLDHKQVTITQGLLDALLGNNCAVISCDERHMPSGLFLPLEGNTVQSERFRAQIDCSVPLRKQLWQQTVRQKILNQQAVLRIANTTDVRCMTKWANDVRSGDPDNFEARSAAYYWKYIFAHRITSFVRDREGEAPNALLNYGYAILRAVIARSLVSSGLLPTLGIHHHNRYNAYCLADDIMEPYRPYVDRMVYDMVMDGWDACNEVNKTLKAQLLTIPTLDVVIDGKRSPLMVAASTTTASLARCFTGESRKIAYPQMDE